MTDYADKTDAELREAAREVCRRLDHMNLTREAHVAVENLRAALEAEWAEELAESSVAADGAEERALGLKPSPTNEERAQAVLDRWVDPPEQPLSIKVVLRDYIAEALAAAVARGLERAGEACADVMRMHRADLQAIDARPDGAAEDWEAYQCIEAAKNAAIQCHAAIRALGEE